MNTTVVFTRRAKAQIRTITRDLAGRSPQGLQRFLDAVDVRSEQLAQFPESGRVWREDVRRLLLLRAPYSLFSIFDDTQNVVTIIACYHDQSDPANWRF